MTSTAMTTAAIVIVIVMLGTWAVSLAVRNVSIVDVVWGLGFVAVAWAVRGRVDGHAGRQNVLVAMTTIWGLRLAIHLFVRNHGKGEDYRYRAMRKSWGTKFPLVSLATVFALQGVLMWIVALPIQLGQVRATPDIGVLTWVGVAVWLTGLVFEVVGDAQLAAFKRDLANAGTVMDRGLWRYTRHPNYFGDACVWWGIGLVGAETTTGRWGLLGPVVMTVLLRRVSGVVLLEKSLIKRRTGYADYVARTSAFIPLPPKRPAPDADQADTSTPTPRPSAGT